MSSYTAESFLERRWANPIAAEVGKQFIRNIVFSEDLLTPLIILIVFKEN
jgi:hypothetical protein